MNSFTSSGLSCLDINFDFINLCFDKNEKKKLLILNKQITHRDKIVIFKTFTINANNVWFYS